MLNERIHSQSVSETEAAGAALAARLEGTCPCFVALEGDLGAGKTAFARGFVSVLSPGSRVKSPTYTIVNEYRRGNLHCGMERQHRRAHSCGCDIRFDPQNGRKHARY